MDFTLTQVTSLREARVAAISASKHPAVQPRSFERTRSRRRLVTHSHSSTSPCAGMKPCRTSSSPAQIFPTSASRHCFGTWYRAKHTVCRRSRLWKSSASQSQSRSCESPYSLSTTTLIFDDGVIGHPLASVQRRPGVLTKASTTEPNSGRSSLSARTSRPSYASRVIPAPDAASANASTALTTSAHVSPVSIDPKGTTRIFDRGSFFSPR